jgi:hypothetical protein
MGGGLVGLACVRFGRLRSLFISVWPFPLVRSALASCGVGATATSRDAWRVPSCYACVGMCVPSLPVFTQLCFLNRHFNYFNTNRSFCPVSPINVFQIKISRLTRKSKHLNKVMDFNPSEHVLPQQT